MSTTTLSYPSVANLGALTAIIDAEEGLSGGVTGLRVLAGNTIATYDEPPFPPAGTLKLLPAIGGTAPPAPAGTTPLFVGKAMIAGGIMGVAAYRA